ncbi:glycosyltransferase, partial [Fulvivirga lutimaris]|uniref:glycosyltransferase n=1 Tax=Fulvivirga lutimaris TaxID=1819566 RepID=UPI0012BBF537
NIWIIWNLARHLLKYKYKVVHSHLIHADFLVACEKVLLYSKFKWISTKHGYEEKFTENHGFDPKALKWNVYYLLCWISEKFVDRSIAVSEGIRRLFVDGGISDENRIKTIYHGLYEHLDNDVLSATSQKYFEYQIAIVGRLTGYKGHKYAFQAFQIIKNSIPTAGLVIIGDGPDEDELKDYALDLGILNSVRFLGFRRDVNHLLLESDVLLVPSISEGFGLVILEAFQKKTPVIAFNVSACNEIIEHKHNGILIEPFDIDQMAHELIQLHENPASVKVMVNNACKTVNEKFSVEKMIDSVIKCYE